MNDELPKFVQRLISGTVLYSLPAISNKILGCFGDNNLSLDSLSLIIQSDPALSLALIRRVNSVSCGLISKITDVKSAVTYLGFKESLNIAFNQVMLTKLASLKVSLKSEVLFDIWSKSILTGVVCDYMNKHLDLGRECYYVSGLFSKVGCLALLETYGDNYASLYLKACGNAKSLNDLELEYLSTTNEKCRDWLIGIWGIPSPIIDPFIDTGINNPSKTCLDIASAVCEEIFKFNLGDISSNSLDDFTQKFLKEANFTYIEKANEEFFVWLSGVKSKYNSGYTT